MVPLLKKSEPYREDRWTCGNPNERCTFLEPSTILSMGKREFIVSGFGDMGT